MVGKLAKVLDAMRDSPTNVRFADLKYVCEHYFGEGRKVGSHLVYRVPWPGEPRVNIQKDGNRAKVYQVRQVLAAITKLEAGRG